MIWNIHWKDGRVEKIEGENLRQAFLDAGHLESDFSNVKKFALVKFWTCVERYQGTGNISRYFVAAAENGSRPDAMIPCNEDHRCELPGRKNQQCFGIEHIPYPFNGMGGHVIAGPFFTMKAAEAAYPKEN